MKFENYSYEIVMSPVIVNSYKNAQQLPKSQINYKTCMNGNYKF